MQSARRPSRRCPWRRSRRARAARPRRASAHAARAARRPTPARPTPMPALQVAAEGRAGRAPRPCTAARHAVSDSWLHPMCCGGAPLVRNLATALKRGGSQVTCARRNSAPCSSAQPSLPYISQKGFPLKSGAMSCHPGPQLLASPSGAAARRGRRAGAVRGEPVCDTALAGGRGQGAEERRGAGRHARGAPARRGRARRDVLVAGAAGARAASSGGAAHEHLVLWRCIPPRALWPLALPSLSFGTSFHSMAWPRRAARWPRRMWDVTVTPWRSALRHALGI